MAGIDQIRQDILFLAGRLSHRCAQSEEELEAARYIEGRFKERFASVDLESFAAVDNQNVVVASYLAEFLVVALLATWWPFAAFFYGAVIFIAYAAEYMGYPVFSRLLPHFESANIVARHYAERPAGLLVITAHYDSGTASPLTSPDVAPRMRAVQVAIVLCMLFVVATCAADGMAAWVGGVIPALAGLRWAAVAVLLSAAAAHFYGASQNTDVRGAITNASGVAALLQIAEKVCDDPPGRLDVWLAATGAHERWMAGMRELVSGIKGGRPFVRFINIESVGAGKLCYTTSEGELVAAACGADLVEAAQAEAAEHGFAAAKLRRIDSAAHIPLARGYGAISLMGLEPNGIPRHWNWTSDSISEVNEHAIAQTADFAHAIVKRLGAKETL
jgi:hypothetical protein